MARVYQQAFATTLSNVARTDYERITVKPLAGALGAEIGGVNLARLDDKTFAEVHRAFLDHSVIVFREQDITPEQHAALGRRFGALMIHEFVAGLADHPEVMPVVKEPREAFVFGNVWHTDMTFREIPPLGSLLYALEVPEYGGDTMFASTYAAYDALSATTRKLIDGLYAIHSAGQVYGPKGELNEEGFQTGNQATRIHVKKEAEKTMEHPVVRTHPETGRKCVFVNLAFTTGIRGMEPEEADPILRMLCEHSTKPDFTCRVRWQKGTLTFWDNRCTQHYALNDYPGRRRRMHRVTVQDKTRPR
ncbi:MAG: taurine dioxygenase [Alphaproteobacteria bacterium]|nr:taurine dioxygenase [Alphaproteobacteria bacterium]